MNNTTEDKTPRYLIVGSRNCIESIFCCSLIAESIRRVNVRLPEGAVPIGLSVMLYDRFHEQGFDSVQKACKAATRVIWVGHDSSYYGCSPQVDDVIIPYGGFTASEPSTPATSSYFFSKLKEIFSGKRELKPEAQEEIFDDVVHSTVPLMGSLIQVIEHSEFERHEENARARQSSVETLPLDSDENRIVQKFLNKSQEPVAAIKTGFPLLEKITGVPAPVIEFYTACLNLLVHDIQSPFFDTLGDIFPGLKPDEIAALALRFIRSKALGVVNYDSEIYQGIWNPFEALSGSRNCEISLLASIREGFSMTTIASPGASMQIAVIIVPFFDIEFARYRTRRDHKNFMICWTKDNQTIMALSCESVNRDFIVRCFKGRETWSEGEVVFIKKPGFIGGEN